MNTQLIIELLKNIGIAIPIGLAFLIVPFGLLILAKMSPWLIYHTLSKIPFIRNRLPKLRSNPLNYEGHQNQIYIDDCHPSEVIKHLRSDGLQSLFGNYSSVVSPVHKKDCFGYNNTPKKLLNSTNPKPVKKISKKSFNQLTHADKSITSEDISTTLIDKNH